MRCLPQSLNSIVFWQKKSSLQVHFALETLCFRDPPLEKISKNIEFSLDTPFWRVIDKIKIIKALKFFNTPKINHFIEEIFLSETFFHFSSNQSFIFEIFWLPKIDLSIQTLPCALIVFILSITLQNGVLGKDLSQCFISFQFQIWLKFSNSSST